MDTSDSGIVFDAQGWCDYCKNFHNNILPNWRTDKRGEAALMRIAAEIKAAGDERPKKTVVFVVDRSGSMSGEKIEQAKGAAKFVLNNLREGDLVTIHGEILDQGRASRYLGGPLYRTLAVELSDRMRP